jgi:hypothetical protein
VLLLCAHKTHDDDATPFLQGANDYAGGWSWPEYTDNREFEGDFPVIAVATLSNSLDASFNGIVVENAVMPLGVNTISFVFSDYR